MVYELITYIYPRSWPKTKE